MSSRRKRGPRKTTNISTGEFQIVPLSGGLPTGATFEGAEVIQDRDGVEYAKPATYQPRKKRTPVVDVEEQIRNPLTTILSLPGVQQSMGEPGALKMSDLGKLKMTSKELRDNVALQEAVAAGTFKRLRGRGDQFIYRYDPVYRHPQIIPQHEFGRIQALNIPTTPQEAQYSNTMFPQEWVLADVERIKSQGNRTVPSEIRELERVMRDRGVGGPPYYAPIQAVQVPRADLATQPLQPYPLYQAHLARRYEMPRNRKELAEGSRRRSDVYGEGTLLFDPLGTPGVPQPDRTLPGKVSRYQIAGVEGPQQGGVQNNPVDLT